MSNRLQFPLENLSCLTVTILCCLLLVKTLNVIFRNDSDLYKRATGDKLKCWHFQVQAQSWGVQGQDHETHSLEGSPR